jgi:WD40 repeat protein
MTLITTPPHPSLYQMLDSLGRPQLPPPARGVVVSAVCWDAVTDRLLLGLAHNAVLRVQLTPHDEICTILTQGHGGGRIRKPNRAPDGGQTEGDAAGGAILGEAWAAVRGLAEHPREPRFASVGDDCLLKIWSLSTHAVLACRRLSHRGLCVAYAPSAAHIAVGCADGSLAVVDASAAAAPATRAGRPLRAQTPALRLILTRQLGGLVHAGAIHTGKQPGDGSSALNALYHQASHSGAPGGGGGTSSFGGNGESDIPCVPSVQSLAFSPDGRTLAVGVGGVVALLAVHSPDGNVARSYEVGTVGGDASQEWMLDPAHTPRPPPPPRSRSPPPPAPVSPYLSPPQSPTM